MKTFLLALCLAGLATSAFAQTLVVKGPTGQTANVAVADLASLPRVSVAFDAHGEKHVYEGPLLIDVLAKVGTPTGKAIHGPEMADVVLVKAWDGYQVAFGLAELDPGTRPDRIILADRADGAPLSGKDGAFKLVAEGDLRPARSARMVTEIEVLRLAKP
uniref:Oxidoreductase molybdopterin-binding domain-containing protein n=1 Tax=Caulobacter sp. (strain K31) TaxID=366602 RepID=B0SYB0_CAUSK